MQSIAYNLLDYFKWSRDCRNQLLHDELYLAGLAGREGVLYLSKRLKKASPDLGYMNFSLEELRQIADLIRLVTVQSLELRLYITYHGQPAGKIPRHLQPYVPQALPKALQIPKALVLTPRP